MKVALMWRWAALAGYLGLIAWIMLWNTLIAPPAEKWVAVVLLVLLTPLLVGLRGMLHGRRYTHGWVSMLSLLYFVVGIGDAYADPVDRPYGILMILLSLTLFVGSIGYVRLSGERIKEKGERE